MIRVSGETWEQRRERMLAETARFIEWGLRHPELVVGIPAKRAAAKSFPAGIGIWFWSIVLAGTQETSRRRWLDALLGRRQDDE